jgi:hypothetical protein
MSMARRVGRRCGGFVRAGEEPRQRAIHVLRLQAEERECASIERRDFLRHSPPGRLGEMRVRMRVKMMMGRARAAVFHRAMQPRMQRHRSRKREARGQQTSEEFWPESVHAVAPLIASPAPGG